MMLRVHCVVPESRSGISALEPFHGGRACRDPGPTTQKSFGGHGERETPGSIPNPEVKPFSADGTARASLWESRTPPDILLVEATDFGGLYAISAVVFRGRRQSFGKEMQQWRSERDPRVPDAVRDAAQGGPEMARAGVR